VRPRIIVDGGEKHAAFRTARAALAASGTVTLELALAQVPTVAAYRIPTWEGLVFRMMAHIDTAILANLVLGEHAVPEYLQTECIPDRLAAALIPLLSDTPERACQLAAFVRLDTIMDLGAAAPSLRAARAVLDVIVRHDKARPGGLYQP
jgi:lipid-A-disaccharide synthase